MGDDIKSSYELAMERLGISSTPSLTDEQKAAMAELDQKAQAKVAEEEIMLKPAMEEARAAGDFGKLELLEREHRAKLDKIKAELEVEKESIRNRD